MKKTFGTKDVLAMAFGSMIGWGCSQPLMERPYKVSCGNLLSVCATMVVLFFLYLYLPFGPSSLDVVEWGMVLGWFLIGGLIVCRSLAATRHWSYEERGRMLFVKETEQS